MKKPLSNLRSQSPRPYFAGLPAIENKPFPGDPALDGELRQGRFPAPSSYTGGAMTERSKVTNIARARKPAADSIDDRTSLLCSRVVGQPGIIDSIVPYVEMFQARLAPENRPAGVFLLLGPTGTGKTRTVEALAEALHGSP